MIVESTGLELSPFLHVPSGKNNLIFAFWLGLWFPMG